MAQPSTDFPDWSSNANYSTGVDVGTPTTSAPSGGETADGFIRQTAAVPQHVNYLMKRAREWFTYLKNLTGEALTWTGVQTFATAPVLSGSVETAYSAARTRRMMIPVTSFSPNTVSTIWSFALNGGGEAVWAASATITPDTIYGTARVPNGAIVTNVRLGLSTNATTDNGEWKAWRSRHNRSTGAPTYTQIGTTTNISYTGLHVENQGGTPSVTFDETDWLVVELSTGSLGAGTVQVLWAEVEYTETRATGSN